MTRRGAEAIGILFNYTWKYWEWNVFGLCSLGPDLFSFQTLQEQALSLLPEGILLLDPPTWPIMMDGPCRGIQFTAHKHTDADSLPSIIYIYHILCLIIIIHP